MSELPFRVTDASRAYDGIGVLPVHLVLEDVRSAYNVGAFFRTADAVGIVQLHLCGITAVPPHRGVAKTALGAETSVPWTHHESAVEVVDALAGRGTTIAAIETAGRAVDIFDWRPAFPVCVIFGHEVDGVSSPVLDRADTHVRLPMRGRKHSLNVATAGGVVLYELLRKYRGLVRV